MPRVVRLLALAALFAPANAHAQYFGKNRAQYRDFTFSIIETEHFDVYYYDDFREAAMHAAQMAERAYARLSRVLNHQYRERQPIILFASHSEFQQNNLHDIGEGVQGVTDPFRHRVMLPFTGSYQDFDHVLQHELVHQFQFDVFARGRVGAAISRLVAVQPPLWVTEGMAEYLSVGAVHPLTAMWLRDAVMRGTLPTIQQLTADATIFPYRFGHALFSYIGDRWGEETVGEVLHAVATSGVEAGFRRALRTSLDDLSTEWHEAVRSEYQPQRAEQDAAQDFARLVMNRRRSGGVLHVSPVLSPDGSEIAYFSDGGSPFVNLYVADAETGRSRRRLVKSAFDASFESLRFLGSAGAWSRDGRLFAFPSQRGGRDDLIIYDMRRRRVLRRIRVPVAGIANPTWSPDGARLAFTGLTAGMSDLYVVRTDGSDFQRLTTGPAAELHPAWSPDGHMIAFATDRGPGANFDDLRPGNLGIALYHLDTGAVETLPQMDGTNVNPQWSPDGRSIAFVSDRTGVANLFLFEREDGITYQLTNAFTGISGITDKSPAISWAPTADRLAVTYYEGGEYNVYAIDHPRTLKGEPYLTPAVADMVAAVRPEPVAADTVVPARDPVRATDSTSVARDPLAELLSRGAEPAASFYRGARGFRPSAEVPPRPARVTRPMSVRALLESAALVLPDTGTFGFRRYFPTLRLDYVVQPTIGYQRDNFGQGVFGGTAVSLSDLLGNRRLLVGGQVNGRIEEAQVLAVYANMAHRTNWAAGYQQAPTFFYEGADVTVDGETGNRQLNQRIQRFILHQAFIEANRPLSRFERIEGRIAASNVSSAELNFRTAYDAASGFALRQTVEKTGQGSVNFVQPSVAWVYDNSLFGWIGPRIGRRSRFEYAPAFGGWRFHQALADYRRYDPIVGPFTLATRVFVFGRFGRDSQQFPVFLGTTDLIRGYTSGSFRRRECAAENAPSGTTICDGLAQLIGSRLGVFNAELRFPLVTGSMLRDLPTGFPPLEGAVFFDAGIAWDRGSRLALDRDPADDFSHIRAPLTSWGISLRGNFLGFLVVRSDYTKPLSRSFDRAYVTISLGPTF